MSPRLLNRFPFKPKRPYQLLQIESTLQCSLACVMCPWTELRAAGGTMAWETFERLLPSLPLAEAVDLTGGGEPLRSPYLLGMVEAAKGAGCQVGFSTNGMLLTPPVAERLVALGLDWISFSVDAASPELYEQIRVGASYATVVQNIAFLRDLKRARRSRTPRLMMVFVMMAGAGSNMAGAGSNMAGAGSPANYPELPAYIELAHSLGVDQVIAKNLDVILKAADDRRRVFRHQAAPPPGVQEALQAAGARARALKVGLRYYALQPQEQAICEHNPLRSLFVNWAGEVSPCITLAYADERIFNGERVSAPCQRFGSVMGQSLPAIWETPDYQAFRQAFTSRQSAARQALVQAAAGLWAGEVPEPNLALPPAPPGCQTCYYLYGV